MTGAHAFEVQTLFRGVVIGSKQVVRARRRTRRATFTIGSTPLADAPVALEYLDDSAHTLLTSPLATGDGDDTIGSAAGHFTVHVTPRMTGEVIRGGHRTPLAAVVDAEGTRFPLDAGARLRLQCGAMTFLLSPTDRAPFLATTAPDWRAPEHRYHAASALGVTAFLLMLLALRGDPSALALDVFAPERGLVKFLIKPAVPAIVVPSGPQASTAIAAGGGRPGPGARAPSGAAGQPATLARDRRATRQNSDGESVTAPFASPGSPTPVSPEETGVLGVLRRVAPANAIFTRGSAFGRDAETMLGQLDAGARGMAYGSGGLTAMGTGSGGGDTGERALGSGRLRTIGDRDAEAPGDRHYGATAGLLHPRPPRHPPGIVIDANGQVRGALDREIVRRVIRRHINEVKFCYEQGLLTRANLGGRIQVQFTIAASGQVLTSVLQSSTLGNARVESCAVQAVRRWEFPRPVGGGLVMVSYPFVLTPAGGTAPSGGTD